jgi:flagella basal body P-ring formation protein FlgA
MRPGLALHRSVCAAAAAIVALSALAPAALRASRAGTLTAREAIATAIADRLGPDTAITIRSVDPVVDDMRFRDAVPDPAAKLGRAIWFTLSSDEAGLPRTQQVLADVQVTVDCVRVLRDIERGHVITAGDVTEAREDAAGAPLHRLPLLAQVVGARALRPIAAREIVLTGFVAGKRAVAAGDTVTVIAVSGPVEVTATLVAVDAGDPGDVIRVVNKETRRYLRTRVISAGVVEVVHGG